MAVQDYIYITTVLGYYSHTIAGQDYNHHTIAEQNYNRYTTAVQDYYSYTRAVPLITISITQ